MLAWHVHTPGPMSRSLASSVVLLALAAAACGGNIERVTADGATSGATSSGGGDSRGSGGGDGTCDGLPECNPGDEKWSSEADACREIAGFVGCYSQTSCGETIWCTQSVSVCAGYPSCPTGYVEVKGCVPDSDCTTATMCGATIICQRDESACLGPQPICDDGDTQVASASDCPQDDARCYSRSNGCGFTIWCTGPIADAE